MWPAAARRWRPFGAVAAVIRLLIVDDNAMIRLGLTQVFATAEEFEVAGVAVDGEEAVRLAGALLPDVVLMDVSMPRLGGIEATRQILAARPAVRVLMLSAHDGQSQIHRARAAGAVDYLHKSVEPEALIDAVRAAYRTLPPEPNR